MRATHLAFCKPMDLAELIGVPLTYALDLMDQALLMLYVGDAIVDLQRIGIRGATDLVLMYSSVSQLDPSIRSGVEAPFQAIGMTLRLDDERFRVMVKNLEDEPRVAFVMSALGRRQ